MYKYQIAGLKVYYKLLEKAENTIDKRVIYLQITQRNGRQYQLGLLTQ